MNYKLTRIIKSRSLHLMQSFLSNCSLTLFQFFLLIPDFIIFLSSKFGGKTGSPDLRTGFNFGNFKIARFLNFFSLFPTLSNASPLYLTEEKKTRHIELSKYLKYTKNPLLHSENGKKRKIPRPNPEILKRQKFSLFLSFSSLITLFLLFSIM